MPLIQCTNSVRIQRSPRVMQLEGLFDIPPSQKSEARWVAYVPVEEREWTIGCITGPSGCGKTTIARELFGGAVVERFDWPRDESLVDAFPAAMGIREITLLLSSVGFSSPPSWLRPFRALSAGEQFRVTIARALAERPRLVVIDEFTSVVDRTVARLGSLAISRTIRRRAALDRANNRDVQRFVAISCHEDIADWLQPDWIYQPADDTFRWTGGEMVRPRLRLTVRRASRAAWRLFRRHHYLDARLHRSAYCFVGSVEGRPAVFAAVLPFPHPRRPGWREHRLVCRPDFQGVGLGGALSEFVASLFVATGRPYFSTTGNPALIRHRARSSVWKMHRKPSRKSAHCGLPHMRARSSRQRITAGFEYVGPACPEAALALGVFK